MTSQWRRRTLGPVLATRGPRYSDKYCRIKGPPYYPNGFVVLRNVCDDYVTLSGPYDVTHSLDMTKYYLKPLKLNGKGCPYGHKWRFVDYVWPSGLQEGSIVIDGLQYTSLDWPRWETMALDKFNPNAPVVDVPLFLFELKDIPRMIKNLVLYIRNGLGWRDMPSALLSYNLGWKPLLGDLAILIDYVEKCNERIQFLKELARKPGVHTMHLEHRKDSWEGTYGSSFHKVTVKKTLDRKVWCQFNYSLNDEHIPEKIIYSPESLNEFRDGIKTLAKMSGFDLTWQTLWNALPWSFLIDYLVNIDDYLGAYRNGIPWDMTGLHIMCERNIKGSATSASSVAPICEDGFASHKGKFRRYIPKPVPHVTFEKPLTSTQWSNVLALSVRPFLR